MAEGDTGVNALVGAVVSIVLAFLPFSTVIGGAVAGYLQGGQTGDGVRVGALSGAVAALPILFVLFLLTVVVPFVPVPLEVAAFGYVLLLFAVAMVFAYAIATAALGGALGVHLRDEL